MNAWSGCARVAALIRAASTCLVVAGVFARPPMYGQSVRSLVNGGNSLYDEKKFNDAEVNYRKALEKEQGLVEGHFNLGNSLYKQGKYEESAREYENALLKAKEKDTKAYAYYNIGNSQMQEQKFQDAVKSYSESLQRNPSDQQAKYNLSYALAKLREQQQQQNKKDKNKDKQDKNDQQKKDQQKKEQEKQDQQQDRQQKDQQKQQQQNQASQQERKMSKADAQRILDVLKNNEKEVQKKLRVRQATRARTEKDW